MSIRVLFVCMGNICRSPTAHGVFRQKVNAAGLGSLIDVRSAGTHDYHTGAPPDDRSQAYAQRRGYDLSDLRASHLSKQDCVDADHVLVMDAANLRNTLALCPPDHAHKVRLLTRHCRASSAKDVPDPYYGQGSGFDRVLDIVEDACEGLLDDIKTAHRL